MDAEEVSDRFVALCFANGVEAYDGEINIRVEENMISNEYVVKLCLEHEIARKSRVLIDDVVRSLSATIYCRDLDTTPFRDLIYSEGRLIPEDPQSGVPRVGIPRPPRASMQDLYGRMGRMEIRQEAIERVEYRQSYHWDRYQGVFEHMAGVYSVPLQGATTHLVMLNRSMINIISSTHLRHHSISSGRMMMSSIETTQVGYVTACFGSRVF
ncbi:hypothetical protein Tco_0227513 [Tanacetum coccineum]